MHIVILGGGAQGRVIAADLAASLPDARVVVADLNRPELPPRHNLKWMECDLSSREAIARLLHDADLGVCALPSRYGFSALEAAIEAKRSMVDVSFAAEDPLALDTAAKAAGVTLVPDAGLAPGISNLVIGHAVATRGIPRELMIYVGGVAEDPTAPFGYVVTWSVDDLLEEYTRPARITRDGKVVSVPVFSGIETLELPGAGTMEAFYSDGLRSLLYTLPGVRDMGEKTLRWPGHAMAVQPLVAAGTLVQTLRERCSATPARDLVALRVRLTFEHGSQTWDMTDRYDAATGRTAMSRTTALTTSVVAQLAASGGLGAPGVRPLEQVGVDEQAFRFVRDGLAARGVRLRVDG
jgi:saccharopine dehydrogenase-like NADP-dependent oxidoreductase